jgi:hypothetical protein
MDRNGREWRRKLLEYIGSQAREQTYPASIEIGWYWLSFCDDSNPRDSQFLGACIVPSLDFKMAPLVAGLLGCNPGGECRSVPCPSGLPVPADYIGRLLDADEIQVLDDLMITWMSRHASLN